MSFMWVSRRAVSQADKILKAKTLRRPAWIRGGSGSWKVSNGGDESEKCESERWPVVTSWRGSLRQEAKGSWVLLTCHMKLLEGFFCGELMGWNFLFEKIFSGWHLWNGWWGRVRSGKLMCLCDGVWNGVLEGSRQTPNLFYWWAKDREPLRTLSR